jgi:hypothetical protein
MTPDDVALGWVLVALLVLLVVVRDNEPLRRVYRRAGWPMVHFTTFGWREPCGPCAHAPTDWPWWRRVAFRRVRLLVTQPSTGHALWIYTRDRRGRTLEVYFDRHDERGDR